MFDRTNRTLICSVVFLDIVGYSTQPVAEQMRFKNLFNGALTEALHDIAVNDRIILDTGDGAAISFLGDPEDALFVVMTLLDHCKSEDDPSLHIPVRVGINLGPVKMVKDINGRPNLIGDGINVAQRIMGFAEPGHVMVSRSYYEVVSCLSESYAQLFQYVGARTDKHVREHEVYEVGFSEQMRQARPTKRHMHRFFGDTTGTGPLSAGKLVRTLAVSITVALALVVATWLALGQLRTVQATPTQVAPATVAQATPLPIPTSGTPAVNSIAARPPSDVVAPPSSSASAPSEEKTSPKPKPIQLAATDHAPGKSNTRESASTSATEKPVEHEAATAKKHAASKHAKSGTTKATASDETTAQRKRCAPGECWANER